MELCLWFHLNPDAFYKDLFSPSLFSFFFGDFHHYAHKFHIHHFEDNIQLYFTFQFSDVDCVQLNIIRNLQAIFNNSSIYKLNLNSKKSTMIIFGEIEISQTTQYNSKLKTTFHLVFLK